MNKSMKITKIKKNSDGDIIDVMLENGEVVPINHAILMAKDHAIEGVGVVKGKNGGEFLIADPDIMTTDNLNDLPIFK